MRISVSLLALAPLAGLALSSCAMTPAQTARANEQRTADQAKLGKDLAGLKPGESKSCLDPLLQTSLKAYGSTLVYRVSNNLAYVNETTGGCEAVERGDILVTRSNSGRTCRGDIATTVMPGSRTLSGSCSLGSFVAYRK